MKQQGYTTNLFSKAVAFVEYDHSGNPHEKYKPGTGLLTSFNDESSRNGAYQSYIELVLDETRDRFNELVSEINACYSATFSKSPELLDAESALKMQLLKDMDAGN